MDVEVFAYVLTSEWNEFLGIREDLFLRAIQIIEDAGTGFAFPSQVNYLARDSGVHPERTAKAEEAVTRWRNENELPFPNFELSRIAQMENRLDFPPQGSPARAAESSSKAPGADDTEDAR